MAKDDPPSVRVLEMLLHLQMFALLCNAFMERRRPKLHTDSSFPILVLAPDCGLDHSIYCRYTSTSVAFSFTMSGTESGSSSLVIAA